jgi:hypothetical protein
MPESHVVSGLVAKRAELAGQVAHAEAELRKLRSALEHLDATIVLFDPSIRPAGICGRRGSHRPAVLPELARHVLDLMRTASGPLTTREMALRLLKEHKLDRAELVRLDRAIGGYMNKVDERLVERTTRRKRPVRWRLTEACR